MRSTLQMICTCVILRYKIDAADLYCAFDLKQLSLQDILWLALSTFSGDPY